MGRKHKGLPQGMTYAEKLARDRMVKEAVEKAANNETVRMRADIISQQKSWLHIASMCEAFGIGELRLLRDYFDVLFKNSRELEEMIKEHGREYAMEKLRQRVEKLTGLPIEYLYEQEIREARERNEARGIYFPMLEEDTP